MPGIPAIFLSGHDDEVFALKAMKVGVQDFIVKKRINSNLLIRSIRYAIERQRLTADLMSMSFVDKLTGIFNRRGLFALAERQLEIADRTKRGLFVVYADLDNMKMINDTLGHSAGDRALKETAEILKSTFRRSDIIARVGGDEFVVVAIEAKEDSEEVFHARLQEKVRSHNACRYGESYRLSVSIGVAGYDTEYPCSFDELLARADKNMFEQKRMKRGSCRDYIDCKRMVLETV